MRDNTKNEIFSPTLKFYIKFSSNKPHKKLKEFEQNKVVDGPVMNILGVNFKHENERPHRWYYNYSFNKNMEGGIRLLIKDSNKKENTIGIIGTTEIFIHPSWMDKTIEKINRIFETENEKPKIINNPHYEAIENKDEEKNIIKNPRETKNILRINNYIAYRFLSYMHEENENEVNRYILLETKETREINKNQHIEERKQFVKEKMDEIIKEIINQHIKEIFKKPTP